MLTGMRTIGVDTAIRLNAYASIAGVTVTVAGRILDEAGEIRPFVFTVAPGSARALATVDFQIQAGTLVSLVAYASAGTPLLGQCFVTVQLALGAGGATIAHDTLLAGYVSAAVSIAWPGSPIASPIAPPGVGRVVIGSNPAAGAEISEVVPTGARWRLLSLRASLVTSAAVANRLPILIFDNGATTFAVAPAAAVQTASLTVTYYWSVYGALSAGVSTFTNAMLPDYIVLMTGFRIKTATSALDGADDWGAPTYEIEEWIEP